MSIRIRILLVAVVAVIAVGAAFYREYELNHDEVLALDSECSAVQADITISTLIHQLQRERGLSAGYLVDNSLTHQKMLISQREQTDHVLSNMRIRIHLIASERREILKRLQGVRHDMDSGDATWTQVRNIYTDTITHLLDIIARNDRRNLANTGMYPLYPVNNLAVAQEELGLARATLYRVYSRDTENISDRLALAKYYGAYTENLRLFMRDSGSTGSKLFLTFVSPALSKQVISQIGTVLAQGRIPTIYHLDSILWWTKATTLIDQIKHVEDNIYADKLKELNQLAKTRYNDLVRYAFFAIISTLTVALLAFFAVIRILSALSVLLHALHTIIQKEDFAIRIPLSSHDEFERIGTSINELLTYTDTILQKKDILASTDLLTNLNNRRRFLELVEHELQRATRYASAPALILCDIDHFKAVNDKYGHDAGDTVLKEFAILLRQNVRDSDLIARWGGEEFIIMVPDSKPDSAVDLAEKIRAKTEQMRFSVAGNITASFGIAVHISMETFIDFVKRADQALYQSKQNGRNVVSIAPTSQ